MNRVVRTLTQIEDSIASFPLHVNTSMSDTELSTQNGDLPPKALRGNQSSLGLTERLTQSTPISPLSQVQGDDMKAQRVLEWREEAKRLSQRVLELEIENRALRSNSGNSQLKKTVFPHAPNTRGGVDCMSDQDEYVPERIHRRRSLSSSVVGISLNRVRSTNSGGGAGLTVAEAVAASHRSRSKRMGKAPLQKYASGYWDERTNVKSSLSCNNLADMERQHRAIAPEYPRRSPPILKKSNSTTARSSAMPSDLYHRACTDPDALGDDIISRHKQQLAIAESFSGSNVIRASESVRHRRRKPPFEEATSDDDENVEDKHEKGSSTFRVTSPRSHFEKKLRDVSGSFHETTQNNVFGSARRSSIHDVRIWTGSWNMGAADPFIDRDGLIDEQRSATMFQNFVPQGYHVYVLGIQEGISENVYHALTAYLNRNEPGTRYYRMELKNSEFLFPHRNHTGDTMMDAVRGRGDGAFVGTKFTGLAVFYSATVQHKIKLMRAGIHKFNLTSGSKGGVAAALMINQTSIIFLSCHLDARNDTYRREQIRTLNAHLGKIMGHSSFDLTEQFHHVIWMGDMNYRIVHLDPEIVLHMLEEGRNAELHDKFDGLLNDRRNGGIFEGFTEPHKFSNFYPTYKKFPLRGHVNETLPSWTRLVYRVLYKEPFYKGGKVKKRVPGWCDRILIHSLVMKDSTLHPEKVLSPFQHQEGMWIDNYRSVNEGDGMDISDHSPVFATFVLSFPQQDVIHRAANVSSPRLVHRNSRSLSTASHGPRMTQRASLTGSYFDQPHIVHRITSQRPNRPVSTVLRVFNMQLYWNDNLVVPKKTRVVAPLMGEDIKQFDVVGERCQGLNGLNLSLNAVIQHTRPLEQLHMLVWVKNESITGHCTLSLKKIARQQEGGEVKFRVPLFHHSMRLYYDGHPLVLVFSVRSKTFAK